MIGNQSIQSKLMVAKQWIADAEYILFTAGAGLSAAAGADYADPNLFEKEFPAMLQYGFKYQYEFIGYKNWNPDLQWGYWAAHVDLIRFNWPKTQIYNDLLKIANSVDIQNTFVMTSNVDAMFMRNGFNPERIFTPQGDYGLLQCTTPCWRTVWPWKDQINQIKTVTDPKTQMLTNLDLIPKCPNCGGTVFPNVRADNSFIFDHFEPCARALHKWLENAKKNKGIIIEVGAGFNTPSVIRWPGEQIVNVNPSWKLLRINLSHEDVPNQLHDRAIGIKGDASKIISQL